MNVDAENCMRNTNEQIVCQIPQSLDLRQTEKHRDKTPENVV